MRIESGLWDGQVLQRTGDGVAPFRVAGSCAAAGWLWARVTGIEEAHRGRRWKRVGRAGRGRFAGVLDGLPAGGPYRIELALGDRPERPAAACRVTEVRVGDVWILAGQSNMQGGGPRAAALAPVAPVRACYLDDQWGVARDPLHNYWKAVDPVYGARPGAGDPGRDGVGPGVSFGQALFAATGLPQGLIACAHGGAGLVQWDPGHRQIGGLSLYGAMLRRVRRNGGRVAGVIWFQGESDAQAGAAEAYGERLRRLIRAWRRDCGDPRLPVVLVQLGRFVGRGQVAEHWNRVQDQQRLLPRLLRRVAVVPAVDLPLSDGIHIGAAGQYRLGQRVAEAMQALRFPGGGRLPPPAPGRVRLVTSPGGLTADILVPVVNVQGRLEGADRPVGFTVCADGQPVPAIVATDLRGCTVRLRTRYPRRALAGKTLSYGHGLDPVCNIHDSAGRPLPVFGPLVL